MAIARKMKSHRGELDLTRGVSAGSPELTLSLWVCSSLVLFTIVHSEYLHLL
jgi:hypothetical protein